MHHDPSGVDECTLKPNLTSVVVGNVLFLIQSGAIHLHSIHFDSRFPTNSINLFSFLKDGVCWVIFHV